MAEYLAEFLRPEWQWIAYTFTAVFSCVLLLALVATAAAAFTWAERKVSARIQDRLGPTRVGRRFGWLQAPADGLKLLGKEDLIPAAADHFLFRLAPYISFCTAFAVYLAIPFADGWVGWHLNTAAFFVLAIAGLEVFGVILGGWASRSKWSLYGAMREAAQVVSYEIPLGLCVVIPVMIAGTMDLTQIGANQAGWFWNWYVFHDPFTFVTFWVFVTCTVAGTNRLPFDMPESESELVAGFMTEYSGFRWSVFFMAEYGAMFALSALGAILFLGAWNGPIPIVSIVESVAGGIVPESGVGASLALLVANLIGLVNFLLKATIGVICMIWLRWTLPRMRIDQVMTTCLKYCIPLSAAMLLGAMVWTYTFPGGVIHTLIPATVEAGEDVGEEAGEEADETEEASGRSPVAGNHVALSQGRKD